jgi:hypothetical protein
LGNNRQRTDPEEEPDDHRDAADGRVGPKALGDQAAVEQDGGGQGQNRAANDRKRLVKCTPQSAYK